MISLPLFEAASYCPGRKLAAHRRSYKPLQAEVELFCSDWLFAYQTTFVGRCLLCLDKQLVDS